MRIENKWTALSLSAGAVVLSLTTWFSATAILPELRASLGMSPAAATWLTNAVQAGFVVGALVSSLLSLSDIMPITRLMAWASLAAGAFNAVALLEPGAASVISARFATGAALALVYPPSVKLASTWFRQSRGLALGVMVGALALGSALPYLMRGVGAGPDWQLVLVGSSVASVIAALLFGFVLNEGPHPYSRTKVDPRQIGAIIRNRPVMLANIGYFGHSWDIYAMWGWIMAYAAAAQLAGLSVGNPAILAFAAIAMGAPASVAAGKMADHFGRCNMAAFCTATSGAAALLIGVTFGGPAWAFLVVATVWGAIIVADSAQYTAAVTELADQTLVGSTVAFQMGVGFGITMITVWLLPMLAELLGSWRWSFLILLPGPVVGAWAMLTLKKLPEAELLAGGRR